MKSHTTRRQRWVHNRAKDAAMKEAAIEAARNGFDCFGEFPSVADAWLYMCDGDFAERLEQRGTAELALLFQGDVPDPMFAFYYEDAKRTEAHS